MADYKDFFRRFKPDARILDVGCGFGDITAEISQRVPLGFVLGVDRTPSMVAQATQKFPLEQYPNLRFAQANAVDLEVNESPFDFVVSRACLHHLAHPGQAFSAIARNLKPGGIMHLWCLGPGNAVRINETLQV
jgi:ubiquinone/menaquinone biosynthesis C-methylase UbiE